MAEDSRYWASGNWHVADGKADEFIERWTGFLTWTKEANEGFVTARLIHDLNDPGHYVSFAAWQDVDSLTAWRNKPEFAEHFGGCRALCTDMEAGNYELVVVI
ncbi:antibiotic biosynthesis monooxygenase family protein [Streptomyces sp. NPDC005408]|uniref:antibiotic biosynthesis monooxygenase family protein n=1 Tax=Streptomyces sp. NPDC005408 TaxID=3155341 RepID=UPI0033BEC3EF